MSTPQHLPDLEPNAGKWRYWVQNFRYKARWGCSRLSCSPQIHVISKLSGAMSNYFCEIDAGYSISDRALKILSALFPSRKDRDRTIDKLETVQTIVQCSCIAHYHEPNKDKSVQSFVRQQFAVLYLVTPTKCMVKTFGSWGQ